MHYDRIVVNSDSESLMYADVTTAGFIYAGNGMGTYPDSDGVTRYHGVGVNGQGSLGSGVTNTNWLSNLISVDGLLSLSSSPLTNLNGLSNLTTIGGDLDLSGFTNNPTEHAILNDISGLSNLRTIGGNLLLHGLPNLTNVDGLSSLVSVGGEMHLNRCQLTNVDGLSSLVSVGSAFVLSSNLITNVDGLSSLVSVGDDLYLDYNQLTNIDGLSKLRTVGGRINLTENRFKQIRGIEKVRWNEVRFGIHNTNVIPDFSTLDSDFTYEGFGCFLKYNPVNHDLGEFYPELANQWFDNYLGNKCLTIDPEEIISRVVTDIYSAAIDKFPNNNC